MSYKSLDDLEPTRLFTMRMRLQLYMRLRRVCEQDVLTRRSMAALIHEALEAFLPGLENRDLTFDEVYIRDRPAGYPALPPSPMEAAACYGATLKPGTATPDFLSAVLRNHYDNHLWNAATGALVRREQRWRAEAGHRVYQGIRLPEPTPGHGDEEDLPPAAREERGPNGQK